MEQKFSILKRVDYNRQIEQENDHAFICLLEETLLLVMKEQGIINNEQLDAALKQTIKTKNI